MKMILTMTVGGFDADRYASDLKALFDAMRLGVGSTTIPSLEEIHVHFNVGGSVVDFDESPRLVCHKPKDGRSLLKIRLNAGEMQEKSGYELLEWLSTFLTLGTRKIAAKLPPDVSVAERTQLVEDVSSALHRFIAGGPRTTRG